MPFSQLQKLKLPLELIFQQVDLIDIFNFSLISQKCKVLLEDSIRIAVELVEFKFHPGNHEILISSKEKKDLVIMIRSGTDLLIKPNQLVINCSDNELLELSGRISKFIMIIFPSDHQNLLAMNYPKWDLFRFVRFWSRRFRILKIQNLAEEFYQEDLRILLKQLNVDDFYLEVLLKEKEKLKFPLKHRKVHLVNASWLKVQGILEMTSEILEVSGAILTEEELNSLLKTWLKGGLRNLKKCKLELEDGRILKASEVLEGIELEAESPGVVRIQKQKGF